MIIEIESIIALVKQVIEMLKSLLGGLVGLFA